MNETPLDKEDQISQVPALQLLQNMGYKYLTPDQALQMRGGRLSNVLLEGVLADWLRTHNTIQYKGREYAFSEGNIQTAVQALKTIPYDGLVRTNEKIYDLLCLGKSLPQAIDGDFKSFSLRYIDWEHPENNVYHVTEEFSVERRGSHETRRPDIILFVNGIPLAVIECKRPGIKDPLDQAISQHIRNQKEDEIPSLFLYSQILLGVSKNEGKYATTGSKVKFWSLWREECDVGDDLAALVNTPPSKDKKDLLFSHREEGVREFFDKLESEGAREVTVQDELIYAICRKERFIQLADRYILYDAGEKKIARYQQFFCVQNILQRILTLDHDGSRKGGVVWHTQGSGKSLTMVMLAKAIAFEPSIEDHKIILVTDRVDLDDQIYKTFHQCGNELIQATTGKHLVELIQGHTDRIITTIIDKFEAALRKQDIRNEDPNIFVLVDEGHRTQYGPRHTLMRKVLPNACYIGFTGTPIMKKDKNTMRKFGGLIPPPYTIAQAVADKAVVPLLYEGRDMEMNVDSKQIDAWFERTTEHLVVREKADLKKKYSTSNVLTKAEQRIKRIAYDVSLHFRDAWQGTGFKGQLVAPSKERALLYKKFLDEFGMVTSEVLISPPDDREGEEDIYEENKDEVVRFWKAMMDKYGGEKEYQRQIINGFKEGDDPEIIIVVSKLLTGFDAPRNTVLYLGKKLEGHALLQAIARVNRLYDGKDFGYIIDYAGVLGKLNEALDIYGKLAEFDREDLEDYVGCLEDITDYTDTLAQKYSDLRELFKEVKNKYDEEAYERELADDALRDKFYVRLSDFARTLQVALSSLKFFENTPAKKIKKYKDELKFFMNVRTAVRKRYADTIDFKEYEGKIQKLVDTYVGAGEVEQITGLVDIFDTNAFAEEVEKAGNTASKADMIAHRTKKTMSEHWEEDPAFYRRFSKVLEEAIREFRAERLSNAEYLNRVTDILKSIQNRTGDHIPEALKQYDVAKAFYGILQEVFVSTDEKAEELTNACVEAGLRLDQIISKARIVNWGDNDDVKNIMRTRMEDYLFELKDKYQLKLTFDLIDAIMEQCIDIAKVRYRS